MDAVITTLIGAAPQLAGGGVLLVLLGLLIRWQTQDRSDYRAQIAALSERHGKELVRLNADHDAELVELRGEIRALRVELQEMNRKLDDEREKRRRAEDARRSGTDPAMGQLQGEPPWPT